MSGENGSRSDGVAPGVPRGGAGDGPRPDGGPASAAGGSRPGTGWTLALDTATPATVAAAEAPDGTTSARIETPGPGERPAHTRRLLGLAEEVLEATGGGPDDVARIVLGLGPGTFTGIRVGVATGRALALAGGARVVGVPTPWALAEGVRSGAAAEPAAADGPVLVVQDARRRELFLTVFPERPDEAPAGRAARGPTAGETAASGPLDPALAGGPVPFTVAQSGLAAALAALPRLPAVAVGDGALAFADVLRAAGVVVPEDPVAHRVDGLALIRAAAGRAGVDPVATPEAVRPVYVRDADAVPTAERR